MIIPTKYLLPIRFLAIALMVQCSIYAQKERQVTGRITTQNEALENVKVVIEGKEATTASDSEGKYSISSAPGDILIYSHVGMETVKILVEDVTRILNIRMKPKVEQLDEVAVTAKKKRTLEEDYATNKNIIKTSFGFIDSRRSSGNIRILDERLITPVNLCILDLLRNKFASVRVFGDCFTGGHVIIRSLNSINNPSTAVFDIDGMVVQDAPIWINIDNIRRVAVLSGLQTTGLYGGLGAGGVVVINTKTGTTDTMFKSEESLKAVFNPNFFNGNALSYKEVLLNNAPQYLRRLHASQTFGEAKSVYRALSKQYPGHPYFFLDAFSYFTEKWGNKNFAEQIIEKHYKLFDNNPVLLKALAYQLEEKGFNKKANATYTDVAKLRTNYIQSYLDLASNNVNLKNTNRALDLYLRIDDLIKKDFFKVDSSSSFQKFYAQEVKSAFPLKPNYYVALAQEDLESAVLDGNTRIVFEWNDGDAEFELQFVSPSGQFTTWKHTNSANAELMLNEKKLGLNSKDFFIDDFQEGIWKINLAYLGNKSLTPTYLKVRIYENYGTRQQSKKQKVFKLAVKETNQELFTLAKVKSNPIGAN